jgi:DsbC/DsbD-like thiol-disulfide interchange protein
MRAVCLLLLVVLAQNAIPPNAVPPNASPRNDNPLLSSAGRAPSYVTVAAGASAIAVAPGARVSLFVDVAPNTGIHVYAPGAKDYLPIAMNLDPSPGIVAGKTVYPKPDSWLLDPPSEHVPVFLKPFRLSRELTLAETATAGRTVTVTGSVNYQACDDKVCYVPASVPVSWTLTVRQPSVGSNRQ